MQQLDANPTDGSRWILKVQPTWQRRLKVIPPTAVGGYLKSNLHGSGDSK